MKRILAIAGIVLACGFAPPAAGHHCEFTAERSGAAMIPPNPSAGHSDVHATLDLDLLTSYIEAHFNDRFSGATAAQIAGLTSVPLSVVAGAALNAGIGGIIARRTHFAVATSTFLDGGIRGFPEPIRGPLTGDMKRDFAINHFDIDAFGSCLTIGCE
ncbi:MAG: hypothetical protein AB7Q17_05310 [Phycisphaerae bacterium]